MIARRAVSKQERAIGDHLTLGRCSAALAIAISGPGVAMVVGVAWLIASRRLGRFRSVGRT